MTVRRTERGALVMMPHPLPSPRTIAFQYNPASLRRRLEPQTSGGDRASRASPLLFSGAPVETIELEAELDAGDQQAFANGPQPALTLQPQLSALELLLYPPSSQVTASESLLQQGTLEIGRFVAPTVLFVWGAQRVLPVRLSAYGVSEEAYDAALNPIRARVSLTLQAISWSDTLPSDPAYALFMAYQTLKESQAAGGYLSSATDLRTLLGVTPPNG